MRVYVMQADDYGKVEMREDDPQCVVLDYTSVGHEVLAILIHGDRLISKPIHQCYLKEEASDRFDELGTAGGIRAGGPGDARPDGGGIPGSSGGVRPGKGSGK